MKIAAVVLALTLTLLIGLKIRARAKKKELSRRIASELNRAGIWDADKRN
jgi:hypothetical protein